MIENEAKLLEGEKVASKNGHLEVVKVLIQNGADLNGGLGGLALIKASETGRVNVVKYLIQSGADVNAKNNKGETALKIALERATGDCARF